MLKNTVDLGLPVDIIYLDFKKAFVKVPQKRLLPVHILHVHGTGWKRIWIEELLNYRKQRVAEGIGLLCDDLYAVCTRIQVEKFGSFTCVQDRLELT